MITVTGQKQNATTRVRRPGWLRRKAARLALFRPRFGEAATRAPQLIRFPAEATAAAPPVRIFVGTDPSEFRLLRVLAWSIGRLRDRGRDYELHVVSSLAGLPRSRWWTPHEGYRAAVPSLAGGAGLAVHCTARTVFLDDPARLIDRGTQGTDWLAPAVEGGPSLIDCAALAARWPLDALRRGQRPGRVEAAGRRGTLPAEWTQAPDAFGSTGAAVLPPRWEDADTPLARLWRAREAEADAAGYLPFTKDSPTQEFDDLIGLYRQMHDAGIFPGQRLKHHLDPIRDLLANTGARTLLDYGAGKAQGYDRLPEEPADSPLRRTSAWPGVTVRCFDPGVPAFADPGVEQVDGVVSTDVVEHLSPWDVAWVLDDMFARARRFVFVVAACYPAVKTLPDGRNAHTTIQPHGWWRQQMRLAARRHPGVRWKLGCDDRGVFTKSTAIYDD